MYKLKTKNRSKIRLWVGKRFYTASRYLYWVFGGQKFAKTINTNNLKYLYFEHSTPLIRKLKDVDMYLQYNKIINLKIAIKKLNGIIINPGETFSYWRLIGKPTKKKGYKAGMMLFCGTFMPAIGGGICQLSNLIYWMTVHTPLIVLERYRHSYDVFPDVNRTQPFGSGATCYYNYRDLMIKNNTGMCFQLKLEVTDTHLVGEWRVDSQPIYSYKVYEKDHIIKKESWGQYSRHNYLYRKIYDFRGSEIGDEYVTENHALMMYQPFLTSGKDSFPN